MQTNVKSLKRKRFNRLAQPEKIYKFGGSSLASAKDYRKVAQLIGQNLVANDLVVVSASGQTTDRLVSMTQQSHDPCEVLQQVKYHHKAIIQDCLTQHCRKKLLQKLDQDCQWAEQIIRLNQTKRYANELIALGELWSAQILAAILECKDIDASWIDARQFLKLHRKNGILVVCEETSQRYLFEHLKSRQDRISIVTGFIASDSESKTLTLGRNGSDYSATLIARLTSAAEVTLWTDVAGVYDFDPNLSDNASTINKINAELLQTLSDLGSPVIHHKTLLPLNSTDIQLSIRSTFAPELKGSTICHKNSYSPQAIVSHKNNIGHIELSFHDELSCQRWLQSFKYKCEAEAIAFYLIEKVGPRTIQLVLERKIIEETSLGKSSLKKSPINPSSSETLNVAQWLHKWLSAPEVNSSKTDLNCSLLALVTEHSDEKPYHRIFLQNFLEQSKKDFTLQHYSKSFVTIIKQQSDCDALALKCFEQWQSYQSTRAIFLLGTGNVGATWLDNWKHIQKTLKDSRQEVVLSANSSNLTLYHSGEKFTQWHNDGESIHRLLQYAPFKDKVVIDATASDAIAQQYSLYFNSGAHIVSANKVNVSGPESVFNTLNTLAKSRQLKWLKNATIGAGLPINHVLKELPQTGDHIESIRGVFSGTLSWILKNYQNGSSLCELIQQAKIKGYSEPDPRLDLAAVDVARKLVIAARLAGFKLELNDVACRPMIAEKWLKGSEDDWRKNADAIDTEFHELWTETQANKQQLVFEAQFSPQTGAHCGLTAVAADDPLAQLTPCDNVFVIHSRWYQSNPLIIRGPGAGKEVTAAALQSDINTLWNGC